MGWWDNYKAWVRSTNVESDARLAEYNDRMAGMTGLETAMTLEDLEAVWASKSDTQKAYPDVLAAYNRRKLSVPLSRATLSGIITALAEQSEVELLQTMARGSVVPISQAREKATALLAADAVFNVTVGIAGVAAEFAGAGQVDTFTDFQKFLRARTGYGGPITMLMKAPVEMALIRPLSYSLHDTFRNELPPLWDIADMDVKGNLASTGALSGFAAGIFGTGRSAVTNKDIFDAIGGYEGYERWYLDAKWDSRWRELRLGEIAWALSDSLVDDVQLDRMLGYAKYAPADRIIIIKFIKARYLRPYRDRVATQFRNEYKEGYISAQDFRLKLTALEIPLPVRDLMISEADALFRLDMHADQISAWEAQYLKTPSMTDAELRALYATIIVDPARIEPRVEKVRAQRMKTPALPKPITQGVRVSSKPSWSRIVLDGADTGKLTPETIDTSVGTHTIEISAPGYTTYSVTIGVAAEKYVDIYAVLAEVHVLTEAEKFDVELGKYLKTPWMTDATLRALLYGITTNTVRVEELIRKANSLRAKPLALPKPMTQGVGVTSSPSYAMIFLDGADTGKLTPETIDTSVGTHTIEISAPGYTTYSVTIGVAAGEFVEHHAKLVP